MTEEQVENSLSHTISYVQDILNKTEIDNLQKLLTIHLHLSSAVNYLIINEKYIQFSKAEQVKEEQI